MSCACGLNCNEDCCVSKTFVARALFPSELRFNSMGTSNCGVLYFGGEEITFKGNADASALEFFESTIKLNMESHVRKDQLIERSHSEFIKIQAKLNSLSNSFLTLNECAQDSAEAAKACSDCLDIALDVLGRTDS